MFVDLTFIFFCAFPEYFGLHISCPTDHLGGLHHLSLKLSIFLLFKLWESFVVDLQVVVFKCYHI